MMNKLICVGAVILVLWVVGSPEARCQRMGLLENEPGTFDGYTLFAPFFSTTTFLIDMEGRVVHSWKSDYQPSFAAYLLDNGHLLRACLVEALGHPKFDGGGAGGRVQEFTWDGELVWDFVYSSEEHLLHHDIERLPNGNVLMIAWEYKFPKEAVDAGRNPKRLGPDGLRTDHIIEVKPTGKTTGEIVWEWHVWDHLIQDHDASKANHGVVSEHPELIHINPLDWTAQLSREEREKLEALGYLGSSSKRNPRDANPDWNHTNSIAYNAKLDQIALSVLGFNEIWIIDHSTTTEEARGHMGGKSGKGGDLLYRWGNPAAYKMGTPEDQQLFAQHDAHWIADGLRGAGNLLIFNNGRDRSGGSHSSVDEIVLPVDEQDRYLRKADTPFGPDHPTWTYSAEIKRQFYSGHISGAQRLPNGNTLVCSGDNGYLFEVTPENAIVWKYVNPVRDERMARMGAPHMRRGPPGRPGMGPPDRGGPMAPRPPVNCVFRAYRFAPDHPALSDRELTPGKTIEEVYGDR